MKQKTIALASTAALLASLLLGTVGAATAFAGTYYSPAHVTTTGSNTLNWTGQGTTGGQLDSVQCSGDTPNPGDLLWIFTTDGYSLTGTPALTVNNGSVYSTTNKGGSWHFVTHGTSPDPGVTSAYVTFTVAGLGGGSLVLTISHGCVQGPAIGSISTAVHLGSVHSVDIEGTSVPLGSTVHDSAYVDSDPTPSPVPAGSSITFYFFSGSAPNAGDACAAPTSGATDHVTVAVTDTSTPFSVDNALAEGPLAAGNYFYYAMFLSGDTTKLTNATSACEPFTVAKGTPDVSTDLHLGATDSGTPVVVAVGDHVGLGSTLHDSASVTDTYPGFDPTGSVQFWFFQNSACSGDGTDAGTVALVNGVADPSNAEGPLAPGDYAFKAHYLGDDNFNDAWGPCEYFTVDKGPTSMVTQVHDVNHTDITGTAVAAGSSIHDKAIVSGLVAGFTITGNVEFRFYTNGSCTEDYTTNWTVAIAADGTAETPAIQVTTPGAYSYRAKYLGDSNYLASAWGACEPFSIWQPGKTMGFWGNVNGQALLAANNAFAPGNAVTLGINASYRCWVTVDSAAKSRTILPNTLNGWSLIPACNSTGKLDSGINANSFNVLLAQTLALSYNIGYIAGYTGQSITGAGCSAVGTLTGTSTVQDARDYANYLIGHAIKNSVGGDTVSVTQGQIGAMNTLLGCLNREQ